MDNFDYSQFLEDDLDIEEVNRMFAEHSPSSGDDFEDIFPQNTDVNEDESCEIEEQQTATNVQNNEMDVSRFPDVPSEEIEELKSLAVNINTTRWTKQWMNVLKSWCTSRRIQNVNIATMAPDELDKLLSKFYAEVKKKDGTDYEPDSLRIMQSALERYLRENGYKSSIVRDREFMNSQQVLNAKALNLRREGKGKRPNKAQPLAPEEKSSLWNKGQLGEHNGRVLTNVNFKHLTEQLGLRGRQEHYDSYVENICCRPM